MFLILPLAALIPLLTAGIGAAGSIGGAAIARGQSRRDIRDQNEYNKPSAQVARLREAGLPMAAYGSGSQTGSQSALPVAGDGGLQGAGGHLSNYVVHQTQLKQMELLKEEIRLKASEADLNEAERDYLLSGVGTARTGTNLTRSLSARVGMEEAVEKGKRIENVISGIDAGNKEFKTLLENDKLINDIANAFKSGKLLDENLKGAELDNKIKEVLAKYQEDMTLAQLGKIAADTGLVRANISGVELDNAGKIIANRVAAATENTRVSMTYAESALKQLSYDRLKAEFDNYAQYQEFVKPIREAILNNRAMTRNELRRLLYTTISGLSGQTSAPSFTSIISHLK